VPPRPRPDALPRALRRQADRPSVARRQPPDVLIAQARLGLITRGNTRPGTKGRQAADAAMYRARVADRAEEETARERLGVVKSTRSMPAMLDSPPRWVDLDNLSRAEARRVARFSSLTGQLAEGKLSPAAFRRRVSSWRPFRGEHFLSDPDAALALLEARRTSDEELFYYRRTRRP